MGEVYDAEHVPSGRRVALKVLSSPLQSAEEQARFLREGQLAASVSHPHTVYIFGSEEIDGTPVISMELLPGGTLKDRVVTQGPMRRDEAVAAVMELIGGLDAAPAAGILHVAGASRLDTRSTIAIAALRTSSAGRTRAVISSSSRSTCTSTGPPSPNSAVTTIGRSTLRAAAVASAAACSAVTPGASRASAWNVLADPGRGGITRNSA